jgi:hypothetical protein
MPTLIGANRGICGEFQVEVGMPAGSALLFPCRRRHGNRFILAAVRRVRLLPEGGDPDPLGGTGLGRYLTTILAHARAAGHVALSPDARELWWQLYPQLTQPTDGLLGQLTARAEAHTIRLALLYTLLEGQKTIGPEHLNAALALWDYAQRSAAWALDQATGDPLAEHIHAALARSPDGLTRTQIRDLCQRNLPAERVEQALHALAAAGRAQQGRALTGGRPAELWTAATGPRRLSRRCHARVGRIARPQAPAPRQHPASRHHHRGERSTARAKRSQRATHHRALPDPAPFIASRLTLPTLWSFGRSSPRSPSTMASSSPSSVSVNSALEGVPVSV